jgi:hypothetical protein
MPPQPETIRITFGVKIRKLSIGDHLGLSRRSRRDSLTVFFNKDRQQLNRTVVHYKVPIATCAAPRWALQISLGLLLGVLPRRRSLYRSASRMSIGLWLSYRDRNDPYGQYLSKLRPCECAGGLRSVPHGSANLLERIGELRSAFGARSSDRKVSGRDSRAPSDRSVPRADRSADAALAIGRERRVADVVHALMRRSPLPMTALAEAGGQQI